MACLAGAAQLLAMGLPSVCNSMIPLRKGYGLSCGHIVLGAKNGILEAKLEDLEANLGGLVPNWVVLGPTWAVLRPSWEGLGAIFLQGLERSWG